MYVYIKSESFFTVGFYDPQGKWQPESDCENCVLAAERVAYLNGGNKTSPVNAQLLTAYIAGQLKEINERVKAAIKAIKPE